MRCLALAQAARMRGHAACVAVAEGESVVAARAAATGVGVRAVKAPPGSAADRDATLALAREVGADAVLLDGAHLVDALATALAVSYPLLVLDDRGFPARVRAFDVLNPNVWAAPADYPGFARSRLLLGADHVLLRDEFRGARAALPADEVRRLLVLVGASDPDGFALGLLDELLPLLPASVAVDVVVGPINPHRAALQARAAQWPALNLHIDPLDMAGLMRAADMAVSACGGTLWELYALGVPVLPVTIAENQRRNAEWLATHGFATAVLSTAREAAGQAVRLAADGADRRRLAVAGQALIDGRGTERVLRHLEAAAGGNGRKAIAV